MAVNDKDKLFLTVEETLASIQSAFSHYAFSLPLLTAIWHLVFTENSYIHLDYNRSIWIKLPDEKKLVPSNKEDLKGRIVQKLQQSVPDSDQLAEICRLVFGVYASAGPDNHDALSPGILVVTDMQGFVCVQCGHCCQSLNYKDGCTRSDYQRWKELGRYDILDRVDVYRKKGRVLSCRIWMDPTTKELSDHCPWLKKVPEQNKYICTIHDLRPFVCRQYPGSRKHARLTGCKGVFK